MIESSQNATLFQCKLHFHWKFNIGNFEKSFRMKWLLFYVVMEFKKRINI
nr:MAG TPA: hypothetical protein [Caudoviricetes sp.]